MIRTSSLHLPRLLDLSGSRFLSSASVNDDEISKFARIGSKWWDPHDTSGAGPLHGMNAVRS